jgi:hypothetical protein
MIKVRATTSANLRGLSGISLNSLSIHLRALVSTTSSIPFCLEPCSRAQRHNITAQQHVRQYHDVETGLEDRRQHRYNFEFPSSQHNRQLHQDYKLMRPQYSLEAIDPDILPLLANQLNMKLKSIGVDNNGNVYSGNHLSRLVGMFLLLTLKLSKFDSSLVRHQNFARVHPFPSTPNRTSHQDLEYGYIATNCAHA